MAGMDQQRLALLQIAGDELAGELEPCGALTAELLQQKAAAAEDARAEGLLESDADLNGGRCAKKAMAMDHVVVAGARPRQAQCGPARAWRKPARRCRPWRVFRHEQAAPPTTRLKAPRRPPPPANWVWVVICTLGDIQESSPASEMTASVGLEQELENGHGGGDDLTFHDDRVQDWSRLVMRKFVYAPMEPAADLARSPQPPTGRNCMEIPAKTAEIARIEGVQGPDGNHAEFLRKLRFRGCMKGQSGVRLC